MKPLDAVSFHHSDKSPTIFMFHGYGADAHDLSGLANEIQTKTPWNWVFPEGPLDIPLSAHWTGHAWWNIDITRWEHVTASGDLDLNNEVPKGLTEIRQAAMKFINDHKIPWSDIVLGGFSQGGMLAMDLFLHAPETPRGLVLLSTSLINKNEWKPLLAHRMNGTFYMSHGKQDQVIPSSNAQRLFNFLKQGGLEGRLELFDGPHTIPFPVMTSVGRYLDTLS